MQAEHVGAGGERGRQLDWRIRSPMVFVKENATRQLVGLYSFDEEVIHGQLLPKHLPRRRAAVPSRGVAGRK